MNAQTPSLTHTSGLTVRVPAHVMLQELDGETVLLNLDSELYLGLNESGTRIFKSLDEADTIEAAYRDLLDRYDVEPERLRQELDRMLAELFEHGLLEVAAD